MGTVNSDRMFRVKMPSRLLCNFPRSGNAEVIVSFASTPNRAHLLASSAITNQGAMTIQNFPSTRLTYKISAPPRSLVR
jgi:hypothetical protein